MISYPVVASGIQTRLLDEWPVSGDATGTVFCIHGVGSRADRFRPTLPVLRDAGYRAMALDLPGHGFADKGELPLSVPFYAEFCLGVLRELGLSDVTIVGTSLGGQIGARMAALARPGEITRVAMIGTLGVVPLPEEDGLRISRVILRDRSPAACRSKLNALVHDSSTVTEQWVHEESRINTSRGADETFSVLGRYFEGRINDHLVIDDVRATVAHTRFALMWGDHDVIVDVETGRQVMAVLPEIPMVWVKDTGHAPYFERPAAFVEGLEQVFTVDAPRESWV